MSERYKYDNNARMVWCTDCGMYVQHDSGDKHDAFHDRIDRLEKNFHRDRLKQALSEPEAWAADPQDDPKPDPPLCAVCGEPVERMLPQTDPRIVRHVKPDLSHDAILTPPEPKQGCPNCGSHIPAHYCMGPPAVDRYTDTPTEPPVGSGWFADKWPGVLWTRPGSGDVGNVWVSYRDGVRHVAAWPDLLPGRPAVPGGER